MNATKVIAVIPARLASQRFPRKVLHPFYGLEMVEHVRRRALMCPSLHQVVVATCDREVAALVEKNGGAVVMTSDAHRNGTDRVAEAVAELDCTHVIVLQGDEPLILPEEIEGAVRMIESAPEVPVWNAATELTDQEDLENRAIVKCVVGTTGKILLMSRKTPCVASFADQKQYLRKVAGFIVFRKDAIKWFSQAKPAPFEVAESIEQSRLIENGLELRALYFKKTYPSVNLPEEALQVEQVLESDPVQGPLLKQVLSRPAGA